MRLVTKAPNQSKHLFCVQVFAFSPQMYVEHARHHQHMHDKGVHKQCLGSVISLNFLVAHCIFRPLTVANEGQSHMATTGACVGRGVLLDTWRNGNAVSRNAMDPCEAHTGIWVRRRGCKWKGPVPPCSSLFVLNGSEADPDSRFEVEPGNMNESRNEATPRQLCTKLGAVGSACMRRRNMQLQQCTACAAPGQVLADRLAM